VESALESGRTQWALELSSHIHHIYPDNFRAKWLRTQALRRRASEQLSTSARNYYLTSALDSYGLLRGMSDRTTAALKDVGVAIGLMRYMLKAELVDGVNATLVLNFTDTKTLYRLQVINYLHTQCITCSLHIHGREEKFP
jgi:alkyl sulfatase BDS1-like metallo-beta-lactamase superfamily hydrolase